MTHNEEFLYRKIRRLEAQYAYVVSSINNLTTTVNGIVIAVAAATQQIYSGTADPNTSGVTPADPTKPAIYNQFPATQWWWHVADATWY